MSLRPAGAGTEGHVAPAPIQAKGWDIVKKMLAFAVILAMLGFSIGCGKSTTKKTSKPPAAATGGFTLKDVTGVTLKPGESKDADVMITRESNFKGKVSLEVGKIEGGKGVTAEAGGDIAEDGTKTTLKIKAAEDAKDGEYTVNFKAKSGDKTKEGSVKVTVEKKEGGEEKKKKDDKKKKPTDE
jgi:hypothetical protein